MLVTAQRYWYYNQHERFAAEEYEMDDRDTQEAGIQVVLGIIVITEPALRKEVASGTKAAERRNLQTRRIHAAV